MDYGIDHWQLNAVTSFANATAKLTLTQYYR